MNITASDSDIQLFLISLGRITFLSLAEKINLLKKLDSYIDLALLSIEEIKQISDRNINAFWDGRKNLYAAQRELEILKAKKINFFVYGQKGYPELLSEIKDAPFMIFYRGNPDLLNTKSVSVVGTRKITPEGRRAAFEFSKEAVQNGYAVVSGLAYGTDGASHEGAVEGAFDALEKGCLENCGGTIAVLPCGCDGVVPYGNRRLAEKIISSGGCIISEYVPGVSSEPFRYVQRNRIIAALSPATVVVQAPAGSGALITADFALDYDRDVMFHKAAFSENAVKVAGIISKQLEMDFVKGLVSEYKYTNTVKKYIDSGASVIEDFNDFCKCLEEIPGIRSEKIIQLNLFEGI